MTDVEMILKYYNEAKDGSYVYRNGELIDSRCAITETEADTLQFEFEDETDNFEIQVNDISSVVHDEISGTIMTVIRLDKTVVMIHNV